MKWLMRMLDLLSLSRYITFQNLLLTFILWYVFQDFNKYMNCETENIILYYYQNNSLETVILNHFF